MTLSHVAEWEMQRDASEGSARARCWARGRQCCSVYVGGVSCFLLYCSFGGALYPAPKRITRRLILSYKRLTLAWLVSCQIILYYIIPSSFCLWVFPILLLSKAYSYSMVCCVAEWLGPVVLLFLWLLLWTPSSQISPTIYIFFCLPVPPFLPPASLLRFRALWGHQVL